MASIVRFVRKVLRCDLLSPRPKPKWQWSRSWLPQRGCSKAEIAGELDCSYQLIGKRGRNLADRGLVARGLNDEGRRIFNITGAAQQEYFSNNAERELNIDPE